VSLTSLHGLLSFAAPTHKHWSRRHSHLFMHTSVHLYSSQPYQPHHQSLEHCFARCLKRTAVPQILLALDWRYLTLPVDYEIFFQINRFEKRFSLIFCLFPCSKINWLVAIRADCVVSCHYIPLALLMHCRWRLETVVPFILDPNVFVCLTKCYVNL